MGDGEALEPGRQIPFHETDAYWPTTGTSVPTSNQTSAEILKLQSETNVRVLVDPAGRMIVSTCSRQ